MAHFKNTSQCHARCMTQRHPTQNERTMFITTVTHQRRPIFNHGPHAREAIECLYRVQQLHPFFLYGFVFMPDHCHLLLKIPEPGSISKMMNSYKSIVRQSLCMQKIWQPRFFVRIPDDREEIRNYIHLNPVKAGLVTAPEQYPWSSASGEWDVSEFDYE